MSVSSRLRTRLALGALLAATAVATSSCGLVDTAAGLVGGDPQPAAAAPEAAPDPIASEFTRDGTVQKHLSVRGEDDIDVVLTMYPTARTPRTHEWFAKGGKYFTYTIQAFDTSRGERDPFDSKREVYLGDVDVTSTVVGADGKADRRAREPYRLDAEARDVTLDPEPAGNADGMLITSPKGSFELQDQKLGSVPAGSRGVTLSFDATVYVETTAGSDDVVRRTISTDVPVAIFAFDERTRSDKVTRD
ncbi:hypothetical protein [Nocardioides sp. CFH 31398]|uniref:hypothetical protein n=1 Tax=Nocardioides sp. CFH 31398 TaxID=2919579 RepID=UPI001F067B40|nr:hypothetical protein [Nocardioides sp. CFH 31398]MCH1866220.1 hypothetical protein [Nocardioides sp. CFH 31398]